MQLTEAPFRAITARFARDRIAVAALVVLFLILLSAVLAPLISPQNPYDLAQLDILEAKLPPGAKSLDGASYWLGTDEQGRDMFSAILHGLRISLGVGVTSTFVALAIGMAIGLIAGYAGGWTDALIMRLVDLQLSFPAILIALVLLAVTGPGVDKIVIALIAVQWAYYARTVRSIALVEKRKEYVEAARCMAFGMPRIVFRHILPNCLPPLIVVATIQLAHAIALEATLSFLGLGVPITSPSLGLLIANGFVYLLSGKYWISFFPGIALLVTIVAINLVGDQLRDILNPRLGSHYGA
ncbi:MAG: ABC transporter permease [Betaproteobacteria bacterium]|nr:ABC transporter permease [Betaproteobacteria bacterium]MDH3438437.1 ABC transporter permease [Betaproteobacteria bacterium]